MMKKILLSVLIVCSVIFTSFAQTNNRYSLAPVVLDTPDFNGMNLQCSNKNVALQQLSKVSNGITDTDLWIKSHLPDKINSSYTFTPGGNRASNELKSKVPLVYQDKVRRSIDLHGAYNVIYYGERDEYGGDFGVNPTLVVVTGSDLSKVLYSFDFSNFSVYKYTKSEEHDFTKISVSNVVVEDNVLYANIDHRTYSSSSSGYNAYLVAVDLETKGIKWVTKPLTCNANFIIDNDLIYTGYGFTKEEDYIYVIDKASGTRLHAIKVEKGPEYFAVKDGKLYVRTYSLDYVFQIVR